MRCVAIGILALLNLGQALWGQALTQQWINRYNGPGNGDDSGRAVAFGLAGEVIVTGSAVGTTFNDIYTAKYAAETGALIWEQRYDGFGSDDAGSAVAVNASGDVVVAGISASVNGYDIYVAKYAAANGAVLWQRRVDGPGHGNDAPSGGTLPGGSSLPNVCKCLAPALTPALSSTSRTRTPLHCALPAAP